MNLKMRKKEDHSLSYKKDEDAPFIKLPMRKWTDGVSLKVRIEIGSNGLRTKK